MPKFVCIYVFTYVRGQFSHLALIFFSHLAAFSHIATFSHLIVPQTWYLQYDVTHGTDVVSTIRRDTWHRRGIYNTT